MAEKKIKRADGTPVTAENAAKAEAKAAAKPAAKPAAGAKPKESAAGYRIGAVAAWVVAIVFEVLAVLILVGKINLTFLPTLAQLIIALVLDLACVIVGSLLWKKANRIDPASKANKVKFWFWNNMGLIVCAFAFIPFVILALTNKNADKKTKTIAAVVAVIALLIGGLVSYDWNPISAEEKDAAVETFGDTDVYWSPFGTVYHTSSECSHLNHSDELTVGTVEQAIQANKTRLCKTCAARDQIDLEKAAENAENEAEAGEDAVSGVIEEAAEGAEEGVAALKVITEDAEDSAEEVPAA